MKEKEEKTRKKDRKRKRKLFGILITYKKLMQYKVMKPKNS
jgi:hypothetical protein